MKLKLYMLSILFISLNSFRLSAQTVAGGDIYYTLISGKKYLVTATVYRMCAGGSLNGLNGYALSDTLKIPLNFFRTEISRINDTCGNPCNNLNSISNPGFEKHIFTDTVDFNAYPFKQITDNNLCKVKFAIHQQIRDTLYTTHTDGNGMFYLDAEVNICLNLKNIHSPVWSFDPKFLIPTWQNFWYHPGAIDTFEFDSISFELVSAMTGPATPVTYYGSHSANFPVTPYCPPSPGVINCRPLPNALPPRGFYFDKEVCEISYSPVKNDEIATIKFRAREWRKDSSLQFVEIGYVDREMRIQVIKSAPDVSTRILDFNKFSVCENNQICLNIKTDDEPFQPYQTTPDTVYADWNHGIPDADFYFTDSTAREKEIRFCWKAKYYPHNYKLLFGIQLYDKLCNMNLNSRGFLINSKPQPRSTVNFSYTACDSLKFTYIPEDTFFHKASDYKFNTTIREFGGSVTLFTSQKSSGSFHIPHTSAYLIECSIKLSPYQCETTFYDTLYLTNNLNEFDKLKALRYCAGDNILLGPPLSSDSVFKFEWKYLKNGIITKDTSISLALTAKKHGETVFIKAWDGKSCLIEDSISVRIRGGFVFNPFKSPLMVCKFVQNQIAVDQLSGTPPFNYSWRINGQQLNNPDSVILESFTSDAYLSATVSDSSGCKYEDSLKIIALNPPVIYMRDTGTCKNSKITVRPAVSSYPVKNTYKWFVNGNETLNRDSIYSDFVSSDLIVRLKLENHLGCNNEKQIRIKSWNLPDFNIVSRSSFNRYEYITMSIDSLFPYYAWSVGQSTQTIGFWAYTLGPPGTYPVKCKVKNNHGCESEKFVLIRTDQNTAVKTTVADSIRLFPNPFRNEIHVLADHNYKAEITDVSGKVIYFTNLTAGENIISTENLSYGYYILKIGNNIYRLMKF